MRELQDTACFTLDTVPERSQQIAYTRSFGQPVSGLLELQQAVTEFSSHAAEKLRLQHSLANQVLVYIRTSPFRQSAQYSLPYHRATTAAQCRYHPVLVAAALAGQCRPGWAGTMKQALRSNDYTTS